MNLSSVYGTEGVENEHSKQEKRTHRFLKTRFRFIGLPFYNGIILGRWEGLSEQRAHEAFMTGVIVDIDTIKDYEQSASTETSGFESWPNRNGRRVVNYSTIFMANIEYNRDSPRPYIIQDVVIDDIEKKSRPITLSTIVNNPCFYIRFEQGIMGTYLIAQLDPHEKLIWTAKVIDYDKEATLGNTINYLDRVCSRDTSQPDCPYADEFDRAIFEYRAEEFSWLSKAFSISGFEYIEKLYKTKAMDMTVRAFYNACMENAAKHILERGVDSNQIYDIMVKLISRRIPSQSQPHLRTLYFKRQHNKKENRKMQKKFEKIMRKGEMSNAVS